jgi:LytS/YehU family sensor histidine kinase
VEDANKYLSIFAALIRETMENSAAGRVSLKKEIAYLGKYLALEKMRFGNSFDYKITTKGIDEDEETEIPVMLLQPYLENAVRHGVRYLNPGEGLVELLFDKQDDVLICKIKDNGKGRAVSAGIRSKQHIEYQSRGMELTKRRAEILNLVEGDKINISIMDVITVGGEIGGTEVTVTIKQTENESED